ncbi:VCBS repeat-containing protein [Segetibacter koreensis]|uniref:VCBS repeat-containing protein n=1 Tax=Segetibacter koreensis TaxID=398037 RepID=UPI00037A99D8|nr:FG-GAP-like repeat-containing protein [Segetibacter koreensis]
MKDTGINFRNDVIDGKIENTFVFRNYYNGGGVAIGDINNDGLSDVFLTSNMGENKLYINKGNFKFEDITEKAGFRQDSMWSTGVVMADINNDGLLDIYVCNSGHMTSGNRRNKLYINNGQPASKGSVTFTESAKKYGLDISSYSTQASFFDYDLDGDLDCFIIANSPMPINTLGFANRRDLPAKDWPVADFVKDGGDHLYRNDNGHYKEVTKEAGIHGTLMSFGLGVSVGDVNNDGYPDVYVSNDSYERDYLYLNQKDGTFKDQFEECIKHTSFSSMGADVADINNDGSPEIFTTDMLPGDDYRLKTLGAFDNIDVYNKKLQLGFYHQFMKNCLQLNNGNGTFSEIANYSGVDATDWSWGALIFDADNDGLNDIYVCNGVNKDVTDLDFMNFFANDVIQKMVLTGKKDNVDEVLKHIPVTPMLNKAFRNNGNLKFSDEGKEWGFTQPSFSNGAAYADLDNDGDLDLIINNENQPAFVYKNNAREQNKNHYIAVQLKGDANNKFAIGSKIKIYKGGELFCREMFPSRGFQSSVDYKQVIGLGQLKEVDSMVITWPDLTRTRFIHPSVDSVYDIHKNASGVALPDTGLSSVMTVTSTLFDSVKNTFEKHQEDDYVDFYYERNIPEMLSREGPKAATGDVNNDRLTDVFIGGTKGHAGQLYIQNNSGFEKRDEKIFQQFSDFEDEAVLFFDADKDGDLDLFIGPGGNNNPPHSRQMENRLFKNDGKGNFSLDASAFPTNGMNTAVAAANDFDHDGDLDLFVGGRSSPRDYGVSPTSYIYVNDGNGHFKDMAETKNPDITSIGMVTGALWVDVVGNSDKELVITGEWMAPKIFSYNGDHFIEVKTNLSGMFGWWQSVAAADINRDGKADLILGNIGENFYLHPDEKNPVKLWIADVDGNGDADKILTRTVEGNDKPVFLKNDLQEQVPGIKKENLKNQDYAQKSIQQLFPSKVLSKAVVKTFNYTSSCVAINNGNGNFTVQKLPFRAQLSSVNAIYCRDVNGDGYVDLITGGNNSGFLPQLERLDASFGDVFINNGRGGFTWMGEKRSGLKVEGEVRDIKELKEKSRNYLLFLRNNDYPMMYRINN